VITQEQKIELKPGGRHLMFFDLPSPIKAGEDIPVTLVFAKHGEVNVTLPVAPAE
jgi:copper(I)-binding protein